MKKLLLALTIFILSVSFYPVKALEKAADILKKNVVTTGDGLYVDNTVDGRYVYKGANPNNYIKLGNDLYRIISVEKDGTIKVIRRKSIGGIAWDDDSNKRISFNSADFCSAQSNCKSWGSNTTTLDSNGNNVTQMPREVNGTLKNLPEKDASLNTYLNNDFYNDLSSDIKSLILERTWNVGPIAKNQTNLSESIKEESAYKWKGKIALMNASDYIKASTNSECTSVSTYSSNSSCHWNSFEHNYLYDYKSWTVSPLSGSVYSVFYIGGTGETNAGNRHIVRPVFYLSSDIKLNGEGSEANPYTISKYVEETKDEKNKDEVKVDNGQIVEVPSTSAQMSIIIASIGIIFISLAVIITKRMTKKS